MAEDKKRDADTPMSEEEIIAATVGERKPFNRNVHIAAYDEAWPSYFEQHAGRIRNALGDRMLQLEHVGSTAVPGLPAKPIIDMVLAVADSADEAAYVPTLEEAGYVLRIREPHWYEHRLLKGTDIDANLHVFSAGCEEIERMIRFRDWLRQNEDDRRLYADTKRRLAARVWKYRQNYADAKSDVVREIMARATSAVS